MWMKPEVFERRAAEMREKYAAISLREVQAEKLRKEQAEGKEQWKDPKRKRSLWSMKRYGNVHEPGPPTAKIPTLSEKRALFANTTTEDLRLRETEMIREIDDMERLIPLLKSAVRNVRAELKIREGMAEKPKWRPADNVEYPSNCPRCNHDRIIRAGFVGSSRAQMFRCKACNSTFVNPETKKVQEKKITFPIICHRCNGTNTENRGPGNQETKGRQGYCFTCNKGFTQGGRFHLEQNMTVLETRIRELGGPPDVRMELLQDAALRVLAGEGYVTTIPLRRTEAWAESRGEYMQRGSDHPVFRLQNDQPMYDD